MSQAGGPPLVSACLIVRDEAEHLGRCLESIRPLADEVVVLDTGSTDNTPAIARNLGAQVFEEPWRDDFSLHRNQAIERASGRWVLSIDADEELCETDVGETRERLEADGLPDILLVKLELLYPNDTAVSVLAPRLFRRSKGIRFVHPVHEQLDVLDAPALLSNVMLRHHGYVDVSSLESKERRNLHLAEASGDRSPHILHCIARSSFSLNDWAKTVAVARDLLESDAVDTLAREACALGAAASFNLRDAESMTSFLNTGARISFTDPDIRLLALLAAIMQYLSALEHGDSTTSDLHLRLPLFYHDAGVVR